MRAKVTVELRQDGADRRLLVSFGTGNPATIASEALSPDGIAYLQKLVTVHGRRFI